jgi:environmental stress-induced protein Ves
MMKRFALKDIPPEPWKNGGGTTRTLCVGSAGRAGASFDWRVSIAEIAESGAFSVFPGIDRIAVVLENGPLRLTKSPALGHLIAPLFVAESYCPLAFEGDIELFANIGNAPVLCLNIMVRRIAARAQVQLVSTDTEIDARTSTILFAAGTGWTMDGAQLEKYEGVLLEKAASFKVRAPATVGGPLIVISIEAT